ncbi:hypothetical protein ACQ4LE_010009 [Meloidogyne hapla]
MLLIIKLINLIIFLSDFGKLNAQTADMDKIGDLLPGLNFKPNFEQYSGYLQASDNYMMHYWFVTSQNKSDKLIFWFNGGPGCSSLAGLLDGMGPYLVNPDGKSLRKNEYAWNKDASVAYIESPVGVGYSYSLNGKIKNSDDTTAKINYEAIKQFFEIHNSYRNHSVYITGESYAGVYIPMLATKIIDGQKYFQINLKGIAIGNGFLSYILNLNTAPIYAYNHGLIDETFWKMFGDKCCKGCVEGCNIYKLIDKNNTECITYANKIYDVLWNGKINPYDIYRNCDNNTYQNKKQNNKKRGYPLISKLILSRMSSKNNLLKNNLPNKISYGFVSPCIDDTAINTYMGLPEVKLSLHIPQNQKFNWEECNSNISDSYNLQYDDTTPFVKKILKANISTMFYYGDTDSVCNFIIGQKFTEQLGYGVKTPSYPWIFNGQVGGFITEYHGNLTYLTVRGVGHMVVKWAPAQAEYIIKQFLNGGKI